MGYMYLCSMADWDAEVHWRRCRWADRVCSVQHERCTLQALTWCVNGTRKRGRPFTRWTDSLSEFFQHITQYNNTIHASRHDFWMTLAKDEDSGNNLEEDYLNSALGV